MQTTQLQTIEQRLSCRVQCGFLIHWILVFALSMTAWFIGRPWTIDSFSPGMWVYFQAVFVIVFNFIIQFSIDRVWTGCITQTARLVFWISFFAWQVVGILVAMQWKSSDTVQGLLVATIVLTTTFHFRILLLVVSGLIPCYRRLSPSANIV